MTKKVAGKYLANGGRPRWRERPLGVTLFLTAALALVATIGALIPSAGRLIAGPSPRKVVVKKVQPPSLTYTQTPAGKLFSSVSASLASSWTEAGPRLSPGGIPTPFNCLSPTPTISQEELYSAKTVPVQVVLAAYPAGVGAMLFSHLGDASSCEGTTSFTANATPKLGVEAKSFNVRAAGGNATVLAFRRGDLVVFVSTAAGSDTNSYGQVIDNLLSSYPLSAVCSDQNSAPGDITRNPLAANSSFTGKVSQETVTVPKAPLPTAPAGVTASPLPAPKATFPTVKLPSDNVSFPLYPPLPKQVDIPTLPTLPKDQKLSQAATYRVADPVGPGCGWSFLSTLPAPLTAQEAQLLRSNAVGKVSNFLNTDGARWQGDVVTYWRSYGTYLTKVQAYNKYATKVETVRAAWNVIKKAWAKYYKDYAAWQKQDNARNKLILQQKAAQALYAKDTKACAALPAQQAAYQKALPGYMRDEAQYQLALSKYTKDYAAWQKADAAWRASTDPNKGPEPVAPTKPVEPKAPVEPQAPTGGCPTVKPPILAQKVPPATAPPAKPKDPRPGHH